MPARDEICETGCIEREMVSKTECNSSGDKRTLKDIINKLFDNFHLWASIIFVISTVFHSYKLTCSGKDLVDYFTFNQLHRLFPLAVNAIMVLNFYCVVSNLGFIEISLGKHNQPLLPRANDVETLQRALVITKTRNIYYIRFICWLCCWPLLLYSIEIFATNKTSSVLFENPETALIKMILIEALVSAVLISSFTYNVVKCIFGVVSLVIQFFIVITVQYTIYSVDAPACYITTFLILPLFTICWIFYLGLWISCEAFGIISDKTKENFWTLLDLIHFVLLPGILAARY